MVGGSRLGRLLSGRVLFLGGSTALAVNEHGIRTGDLSGLVTPLIRWPLSEIYAPGAEIALMSHWPGKIEAMARACVSQDIRMISGMPSWALVLFERVIALARERFGADHIRGIRDVWPNLTSYSRWLLADQTPLVLLALAAPFLLARVHGPAPRPGVAAVVMCCVFTVATLACYLAYIPFDSPSYLRFLLPEWRP